MATIIAYRIDVARSRGCSVVQLIPEPGNVATGSAICDKIIEDGMTFWRVIHRRQEVIDLSPSRKARAFRSAHRHVAETAAIIAVVNDGVGGVYSGD